MKRLFALSILCAACDPIISIDATIVVSPEVQDSLTYPQEVVIDFGGEFGVRRAFILCDASAQDVIVNVRESSIGCAEEATVRVWSTPFTPAVGEEVLCGDQSELGVVATNSLEPLETDPKAEQIIFTELDNVLLGCASANEAVDLTLSF